MKTKRFLAWFLTLAMLWSLIPNFGILATAETGDGGSVLLADEPDEPTVISSDTKENTNQAGGIVYTKTSTAKSDGTIDITLTAHTTGVVRQLTSVTPTDIVLVLDVSGSMDYDYTTTRITGYNKVTGSEYTYTTGWLWWREEHTAYGLKSTYYSTYYINIGTEQEPVYTRVAYTGRDENGFEMFAYSLGNTEVTVYPVLQGVISDERQYPSYNVVQFYSATVDRETVKKMTSLQNAVNAFIDATAQMNYGLEADQMHNISIVKFASNSYYNSIVPTVVEGDHMGADNRDDYNYSEVVKNLTPVDAAGAATLKTAVNALKPGGATAVDYGLNLAEAVLMNRSAVTNEGAVDRKEVIIVFSDGSPTHDSSFQNDVANKAITVAGNMKSAADVTIYSVCIDTNADATDIDENINKFMHYVSSNYPDAKSLTNPGEIGSINNGYYLTPDSTTSLLMIFESIIQDIDHPSITLGEEATMVDTISTYFDFQGDVEDVKLQTSARNSDGTWADPVDDENLVANITGDRLTVDGFDFDANYVSETGRGENGNFYGKRLVVSFTVVPDYDAIDRASATLTNGIIPTNSGFAALVDSDFTPAAEVATPQLSAHTVTYKVDGKEYISYSRFTGSDVWIDAIPEKEGHTFSGWSYPSTITVEDGKFEMPDNNVEITGTFTAKDYNVKYRIDGYNPGASLPNDEEYSYGETVSVEDHLAYPGYTFSGWITDDVTVDEGEFIMPAHEVIFYGSFEPSKNIQYMVEYYFENLDGETNPAETNDYTEDSSYRYTAEGTLGTIARAELKNIAGFTLNRDISTISGKVTIDEDGNGDLVLTLYYQRNRHNVTYSYVGDSAPDDTDPSVEDLMGKGKTGVKYGTEITVIAEPTIPDDSSYSFVGWSADNVDGISAGETFTMPDNDVNIKGSFKVASDATYKVEHHLQDLDGNFIHDVQNDVTLYSTPGETAYVRLASAFKYSGYKLADKDVFEENYSGQTYNETEYILEQIIADGEPVEIFKIYYVREEYPVTYEFVDPPVDDMPNLPDGGTYVFGSVVSVDTTEISIPGYSFSGWNTEDAIIDNGEFVMPAKAVILRGRFSPVPVEWKEQHYLQNIENPDVYDLDDTATGNIPHSNMTGRNVTVNAGHYPGFELNKDKTNEMNAENDLPELDSNDAVTAVVLSDGSLVVRFYYDRNNHSVTYEYTGTSPDGAEEFLPEKENNVPYGKEVSVAADPVIPGYTFSGWTTADATVEDGKFYMPDKNVVFKGNFAAKNVEYKVNYWLQNLTGSEYTLAENESYTDTAYVDQFVQAKNQAFVGFSLNANKSSSFGYVTVDEDGIGNLVLNLYYDRHTYNVTYRYYGEQPENAPDLSGYNKTNVRFGTELGIEEKPELAGYVFDGWLTRTATVTNNKFTMPDHDVTFLGLFIAEYTVSYDLNGGTGASDVSYDNENVTKDTVVSLKAEPTRTDYIFTGWSDGANIYQPDDDYTVTASVKFTAQWDEDKIGKDDPDEGDEIPDKYQKKIIFKIINGTWNDGTNADIVVVVDLKDENNEYSVDGTANISSIIPTGMVVNEGYEEPGEWREAPPVNVSGTETETYTYVFHKTPDVVYDKYNEDEPEPTPTTDEYNLNEKILVDPNGGVWHFDGTEYTDIQTITLTDNIDLGTPTRTDYVFMGWKYSDPTPEQQAETIKGVYTAQWEKDEIGKDNPDEGDDVPDKYQKKIIFKIKNGKWSDDTTDDIVAVVDLKDENGEYSVDGTAVISTITPTGMSANSGYRNGKWDVNPPETVSGTADVTYTYSYTKSGGGGGIVTTKYTLTYETNGGNKIASEQYSSGATVKLTKVPVKDGYVFEGWHLDEALTEDVTEVKMTKNITVYAAWVEDNGNAGNGHETPDSLNGENHFAYVVGYPDGTVRPNDNISRAEVTAIFFRLLKPDEVREQNLTDENGFADVNTADWYNKAISTMAKLGIVNGRTEETFVPDAFITRAEFAAICARFDNSEFEVVDNFTDVNGHWAENEIHEAAAHGWIRGYEDGTFKPNQFITRAEAMTMINRVLNRVPETADDLLADMINWPDNSDKTAWYYLAVQEATNSHDYEMKNHIYEKWTALREVTDWTEYE